MPKKAQLTDAVKRHIVTALACFDTPTQVAESVKEEFGIVLTRQSMQGYDPTKAAGKSLAKVWRELFFAQREAFKAAANEIPIAQRAYRLRALERMATKAENSRNLVLAASLYEQAAKEVGDVYTNRTKVDANVKATARVVMVPAKEGKAP